MTDLFMEKAKDWDANDRITALSSAIGASIIGNVTLNAQMHVMDFGAGTGLIATKLAPHVGRITAVDVSQSMLDQLAAKQELRGKVETLCRDIVDQPIAEKFDLIVSAMAMHHVQDTDKMVRRFSANLKPGARIALADLDREDGSFHPQDVEGVYHAGFDRDEFRSTLEKHGFTDIKFVTAHTVYKEEKAYPVFLAVARKG